MCFWFIFTGFSYSYLLYILGFSGFSCPIPIGVDIMYSIIDVPIFQPKRKIIKTYFFSSSGFLPNITRIAIDNPMAARRDNR